ncbi:hypothetical protein SteCoe_12173 [Stentor coeruleus]|uniref:Myb-like DNA-binding domain containing protein n=1 Tax=Stentor coeruleus TaxID=5963 RepID=A0A1R2CBG8_9CILI|nr:hypothetical protein SteCoe_12173 [Stentor coeruleus]
MSCDYRRPWSTEEDIAISALVEEFGLKKWSLIAQQLSERYKIKNRSGKQCRERWHNHLDSSIDKKPWTQEEDNLIFELHKQYGKSWSKIAENIPGRTDNSVKNRFYSTLRRNLRKYNKSRPHSQRLIGSVRTILRNPNIPDILLQEQAPPRLKKLQDLHNNISEENQDYNKQISLEDTVENINENLTETLKSQIVVPVPCPKLEKEKKVIQGFERFTSQIEDASLLFNLSQPELNYFYFYPQALANYKNNKNFPPFMCPMIPPAVIPMILSNSFLKQDVTKK